MSIYTKQGELLVVQIYDNKVYCDACRQGMTKQEALDYADSLKSYADKIIDPLKPEEYEYLEIKPDETEREYIFELPDIVHANGAVQHVGYKSVVFAIGQFGFLGYAKAKDQRDNFQQHFTANMKFVMLRKDKP